MTAYLFHRHIIRFSMVPMDIAILSGYFAVDVLPSRCPNHVRPLSSTALLFKQPEWKLCWVNEMEQRTESKRYQVDPLLRYQATSSLNTSITGIAFVRPRSWTCPLHYALGFVLEPSRFILNNEQECPLLEGN